MTVTRRPAGRAAPFRHFVLGITAVAVLLWSVTGIAASAADLPPLALLVLVGGLILLSEVSLLHVRFGHDHFSFTWGEAALLIGFAVVGPEWFVLLALPCVLAVHLFAGRAPIKAIFNAAAFTVASSVAMVAVGPLSEGSLDLRHPAEVAGLVLACTVFSLLSNALTARVVALSQGIGYLQMLRQGLRMSVVVWAGNLVVGGAVLILLERSPSTLVALPPLMLVLFVAYRGCLRALQERDVWRQLEMATRELNVLDEGHVATAALQRASQLFRTDNVELLLHATSQSPARLYTLDGNGLAVRRTSSRPPLEDTLRGDSTATNGVAGDVCLGTCLAAPLEGPRGPVGSLRLLFDGPVKLTGREQQVLSTFTHAVSATVLNAALYDDVRAEAAKHAYQATHDSLTGLANRALLHTCAANVMLDEDGTTTALLLLDLDHFKEVNDTLGHAAGDVLLQQIAGALQSCVRESDLVARLGGDEFAVLLTGLENPAAAGPVAAALLRKLSEPVEFEGLRLSVEGSLGVACHPQDAGTAEELFRRADVAMYQAKGSHASWLRYSADRDDSSVHRQALVPELRAALEHHQLVVHYQPQIDLETRLVVGAEALCRWDHPTRGLLPPSEFVGVAEESGLVRPFTLWVLDTAVAECVSWQGERPLSIAVNLSARSLLDPKLPEDVAGVLSRHGLPPDRLILEITETTAASELRVVEGVLARLRRLGVEISVDDFGTGYSSLAFLQRTAVNELKVDRSFVAGMLTSENDLALVRTTVQLAHSLGARSVAEGVQDSAMAAALRDMGCDVAQGFWLSQPLPAAGMRELLTLHVDLDAVPTRPAVVRLDAEARRLRPVGATPIARSGS